MATPPEPPKPTGKGASSLMKKKVAGIPLPIFAVVGAVLVFVVYRHFKNADTAATPNASSAPTASDPNAVGSGDLGAASGAPSTDGSGAGGVGGTGIDPNDLANLFSSLEGLGATNYYYGSDALASGPGNGAGSGGDGESSPAITPQSPASGGGSPSITPADIASALGQSVGSPNISGYTVTTGGNSVTSSIDLADVPKSLANQPIVPIANKDVAAKTGGSPSKAVITAAPNPTVSANKTGASANKSQGVYSIH